MSRHADNARDRIIDAAEQVVIEDGTRNLTFDAVAEKSQISRGGLLYHFPDKESLLTAMLDRHVDRLNESRAKKRAQLPATPYREIAAHVLSALGDVKKHKVGSAAFFALAAHDPAMLAPFKQQYRKFMHDVTGKGLRFQRAAVIALATDGLRVLEFLSMSPFDEKERATIVEELLELAKKDHSSR